MKNLNSNHSKKLFTLLVTLMAVVGLKAQTETTAHDHIYNHGICEYCGVSQYDACTYYISTGEQLHNLAMEVNNSSEIKSYNVSIDCDIDYREYTDSQSMLGDWQHPFNGTIEGHNHLITINFHNGEDCCALVSTTQKLAIYNLRIGGDSKCQLHGASFVGKVDESGSCTLENCMSSVALLCESGYNKGIGGLIGVVCQYATSNINNCAFVGSLGNSTVYDNGGLVGSSVGTTKISNSYVSAKFASSLNCSYVFGKGISSITNCYYNEDQKSGTAQGQPVSAEQVKNGYLCTQLGKGWRQTITKDTYPRIALKHGKSGCFELQNNLTLNFASDNVNSFDLYLSSNYPNGTTIAEFTYQGEEEVTKVAAENGCIKVYKGGTEVAVLDNNFSKDELMHLIFEPGHITVNQIMPSEREEGTDDAIWDESKIAKDISKVTLWKNKDSKTCIYDLTFSYNGYKKYDYFPYVTYDDTCHLYNNVKGTATNIELTNAIFSNNQCQHCETWYQRSTRLAYQNFCPICHSEFRHSLGNFVRTNGSAYFNTGVIPSKHTTLECGFKLNEYSSYNDMALFGTSTKSGSNAYCFLYTPSNSNRWTAVGYKDEAICEYEADLNSMYYLQFANDSVCRLYPYFFHETPIAKMSWTQYAADDGVAGQELYVGTRNGDNYTDYMANMDIYDFQISEYGKMTHNFTAAYFNGQPGMFDTETLKFIPLTNIENAQVYIMENCEHEYTVETKEDGIISNHCYICDTKLNKGYYMKIHFDANKGEGTMIDQEIGSSTEKIKKNNFKHGCYIFDGWNTKANGTGTSYKDESAIAASESTHGDITLYAMWANAFAVNNDSLIIARGANVENIVINDDGKHGFKAAEAFKAKKISYNRKFTTQWGSLCLPFAVSANDDVAFYVPCKIENKENDNSILYLKKVDEVAAGQPVIYNKVSGDSLKLTGTLTDGSVLVVPAETLIVQEGGLYLEGCYATMNVICDDSHNYYGVKNDCFYQTRTSVTVAPYHAYFYTNASNAAKLMIAVMDDEETAIAATLADTDEIEGYYTLEGIKQQTISKGLNIVKYKNGRTIKIMIK